MAHRYTTYNILGFRLKSERQELYLVFFLRSLAASLTGIFIPIFLYQELGLSLATIALFFALHYTVVLIASFPVARLIKRFSLRFPMIIGLLLSVLYFILLWQTKVNPALLWSIPLINGLATAFFWIPYNTDFLISNKPSEGGKSWAWYNMLGTISTAIAPLIGGILITFHGFQATFNVSIAITFLAIMSSFLLGEQKAFAKKISAKTTIKNYFKQVSSNKIDTILTLSEFPTVIGRLLWPIFLIGILASTIPIGALALAPTIAIMALNKKVGTAIDKKPAERQRFMRNGLIGYGWLWALRLATSNFLTSFLFGTTSDLFFVLYNLPLNAYVFGSTPERNRPVEFMLRREVALNVGRILTLLILAIVATLLTASSSIMFMFLASGAVSVILSVLVKRVSIK